MSHKRVDFFYLGPPKSASTWVYECLKEHPSVQVSRSGEPYFFDKYYHNGFEWYQSTEFPENDDRLLADCTPTYIYEQLALARIVEHNPKAKFSIGLRNPVERAFSQYWHVKKKNQINMSFEDSVDDYCAFRIWVQPSMVAPGIAYLKEATSAEQLHFFHFDRLKKDAPAQLRELCDFIGIKNDYTPSLLNKKINEAGAKWSLHSLAFDKIGRRILGDSAKSGPLSNLHTMLTGRSEYINGVSEELYQKLYKFYEGEIHQLEDLTQTDLGHWKENPWSNDNKMKESA